jgi:uncharacterized damage-inducible protein DinB
MPAEAATLATFYAEWHQYQENTKEVVRALTAEQLALRAAPTTRTVGEIAAHIISGRLDWFGGFLGEAADPALLARWGTRAPPPGSAADLVAGLDRTWHFMADAIARWTEADMAQTYPIEWRGNHYELTRGWVVWHILSHDLHHGGEISLTLGIHGIAAADIYAL